MSLCRSLGGAAAAAGRGAGRGRQRAEGVGGQRNGSIVAQGRWADSAKAFRRGNEEEVDQTGSAEDGRRKGKVALPTRQGGGEARRGGRYEQSSSEHILGWREEGLKVAEAAGEEWLREVGKRVDRRVAVKAAGRGRRRGEERSEVATASTHPRSMEGVRPTFIPAFSARTRVSSAGLHSDCPSAPKWLPTLRTLST